MFRAERYNVRTNRIEQLTLREITDPAEINSFPPGPLDHTRFKPFEQLDADCRVVGRVWRTTDGLEGMAGEWIRFNDRFMRTQGGIPQLDGMGEPLLASDAGCMLSVEPVALSLAGDGSVTYRTLNAFGQVLKGGMETLDFSPDAPVLGSSPVSPAAAPPPAKEKGQRVSQTVRW